MGESILLTTAAVILQVAGIYCFGFGAILVSEKEPPRQYTPWLLFGLASSLAALAVSAVAW